VDREELRRVQAPLKTLYQKDPASAVVTLRAEGRLGSEEVSCSVQTGRALVEAGLHPASGGDGQLACSGDMLLQALVACAGVTLRSVATNRGVAIEGTVQAEGDLDFRGTMGVDRGVVVGFTDIRLRFDVTAAGSQEELDAILAATERYCVVLQTLMRSPRVTISSGSQDPAGQ
jgi:uncharacterized OsmC-like protein